VEFVFGVLGVVLVFWKFGVFFLILVRCGGVWWFALFVDFRGSVMFGFGMLGFVFYVYIVFIDLVTCGFFGWFLQFWVFRAFWYLVGLTLFAVV